MLKEEMSDFKLESKTTARNANMQHYRTLRRAPRRSVEMRYMSCSSLGGVVLPERLEGGCAAHFSKPLPYL